MTTIGMLLNMTPDQRIQEVADHCIAARLSLANLAMLGIQRELDKGRDIAKYLDVLAVLTHRPELRQELSDEAENLLLDSTEYGFGPSLEFYRDSDGVLALVEHDREGAVISRKRARVTLETFENLPEPAHQVIDAEIFSSI